MSRSACEDLFENISCVMSAILYNIIKDNLLWKYASVCEETHQSARMSRNAECGMYRICSCLRNDQVILSVKYRQTWSPNSVAVSINLPSSCHIAQLSVPLSFCQFLSCASCIFFCFSQCCLCSRSITSRPCVLPPCMITCPALMCFTCVSLSHLLCASVLCLPTLCASLS